MSVEEKARALSDLLGDEQSKKVLDLEQKIKDGAEGSNAAVVLPPESDKTKRKDVHQ